ncbi:Sir2 family NAD-dependent protein deacetylase [Blastopirellula sp. JC732]|uniref:protein acetyllysine N-acetyltransferase n=1 Tax=Blastopirellula sediminis TaxID=2894196 RepID=A0A9X1MMX2_9BACT|nr:Sir2 family NAD-dependent protein deacetylase [Blastopirellula sediminis]MCC9606984.1 Sir2 family NAD-dependent protein deacetylase [Blastopirellula sediminis]MCC9629721.1 Sir2 family NAD-dependent protein deacetylase [Blastopirellula sediminis]
MSEADDIALVAKWLAASKSTVLFTGAGISTESGIPDFRSPGGVWTRYRTIYFDEFCRSPSARREYWEQKAEAHTEFAAAAPNAGHQVLAEWESRGVARGVITQNIDGLHQIAGNQNVLELHGTARAATCLDCSARFDIEPLIAEFRQTGQVPLCPKCVKGRLKHATVSFGQMLPTDVLERAYDWCGEAELILAIGSSLVVTPAADLPVYVKRNGGRIVILNRDETGLDSIADVKLTGGIGATLSAIDVALSGGA